jgi:hypothetical protein
MKNKLSCKKAWSCRSADGRKIVLAKGEDFVLTIERPVRENEAEDSMYARSKVENGVRISTIGLTEETIKSLIALYMIKFKEDAA